MVQYSGLKKKMEYRYHFKNGKSMMNRESFRNAQTFSKLCKSTFLLTLFCYLTNSALAQEITGSKTDREEETKSFPAQVSIFYPYGTHGRQSTDYTYNFSLNLLYGKIGGLKGIEISGLVGLVKGDVHGVQIAGLVNGAGNMNGIQAGGIFNGADNVKGIQVGGAFNGADDMKGIQVGGIFNGAYNVNGLQISGIYNRSNVLRGVQIGLVSVNDTIEKGISLSLVNIVKRGFYREWELSFSDYANVALSYKMGMQRFYTIYTVGASFTEDNLWSFGLGFGNRTSLGNRFDFRPELVSYSYYPMDFKNVQSTFATHLKFGFVYNISEKLGLSLVPSVYVMNSNQKSNAKYYNVSPIGALYTHENNNARTMIGVGASLGLSLR